MRVTVYATPRRGSGIHLLYFPGSLLQARLWVGQCWGLQLPTDRQTEGQREGEGWVGGGQGSFLQEAE